MNKYLPILTGLMLVSLTVLVSCSIPREKQNSCNDIEPQIPSIEPRDNKFGLVFSISEIPPMRSVDTKLLSVLYVANNGYSVQGRIQLDALSIYHSDGSLLAKATIDRCVEVLPRKVFRESTDLPIEILNSQKLVNVFNEHSSALQTARNLSEGAGENALFEALKNVQKNYTYEIVWHLDHPTRGPSTREIRF